MSNRAEAIRVIRVLRSNSHKALLAGGCVRDMLLGRRAKDYDVATSARPDEVVKLFRRTLKIGVQFGVVMVLFGKQQVEVATFRSEADYADGRHPKHVEFCNAKEDAKRRDFTINGMFYDPVKRETIDYVGGQKDLAKRIIRTIGNADERFGEDYLRMLRAVRFSAQLDFVIGSKTRLAICKLAKNIKKISSERIAAELEGTLTCPNRAIGLAELVETGLAGRIFKGFKGEKAQAGIKVLAELKKNVSFGLATAAMFAGFSSDSGRAWIKTLKLSRNRNKHIRFLLEKRSELLNADMSLAKLRTIASEPYFSDLYELQRAIQRANDESISSLIKIRKRIKALGNIDLRPEPLLNGHELIKLGAASGPKLGKLAERMYIAQLEGQLKTVTDAKKWVKNNLNV